MRGGTILVIILAAALAGCADLGTDSGGNPNLLAPKLVVHPRTDGNVTLFIHGAFREQVYDWISLRVDNQTVSNESSVFSAEHAVGAQGFYLEARAQAGDSLYETRARMEVDATEDRLRISFVDEEGWSDPRAYGVPFEQIMDRPEVSA